MSLPWLCQTPVPRPLACWCSRIAVATACGPSTSSSLPARLRILPRSRLAHATAAWCSKNWKRAKEAAESANAAKSAFVASMSHELRTPLNAIIGYSEMLLEDAIDEDRESAAADLRKITVAGQHLLGLIDDVLDFSKLEAGRMQLVPESFDLVRLLNDTIDTMRPLFAKNGNSLLVDIDRPPPRCLPTRSVCVRWC